MKDHLQPSPEEVCRHYYQHEVRKLTELNGIGKIMAVMQVTRDVLSNLKPMQPPDIQRIQVCALTLGIETERENKSMAEEINIFTGAFLTDKNAWNAAIEGWNNRNQKT